MNKLIIASQNKDKLKEIKALLGDLQVETLSIKDVLPDHDVTEDKDTIFDNAAKKAFESAINTGLTCLADDTGLFVDALNGAPGVYAARYAGDKCSYEDNREKLLQEMHGQANRYAEFRTVVVLANPEGIVAYREGIVPGVITEAERGSSGFGYDAVFEVSGTGKTYAEMGDDQKNLCSHRGQALKEILPILQEYFSNNL